MCDVFPIFTWFTATIAAYWNIYWHFIVVLLCLSIWDNLYMIHHNSDFFYDICSKIKKKTIKDKVATFHWLFNNFICFVISHGFYVLLLFLFWFWFLSLSQCINHSSSVSLEEAKIIIIVNSVFHVSKFSLYLSHLLNMG